MKNTLLITASLLLAFSYAGGQTPTVIVNGTVSANGAITGSGVNSSGAAGGQLSLTGGLGPFIIPLTFNLAAPSSVPASYQAVVPTAVGNGIWRGTQAVMPTTIAAALGTGNSISALTVLSGSGYSGSSTMCTVVPNGTGSLATCTASVSGGQVNGVSVTNMGSGYTSAATVTFGSTSGTPATAVVNVQAGNVTSINQASGSGYLNAPGCLILPVSGGSGATCSASFWNGQVSLLTITNPGSGYTGGATISFVPQLAMAFAELTGDAATTGSNAVVVGKVNGVTFPASPSTTNTVPVVTSTGSGGTITYEALPVGAIASIAADTVVGNNTGSGAVPAAVKVTSAMVDSTIATAAQTFLCRSIPSSDTISSATAFATTCSISSTGMAAGTIIEVHAHGVWTTTGTTGPQFALEINAGATLGICPASTATTLTVSQTNWYWDATCYIQIQTVGTSGTAVAWGNYIEAQANGGNPSLKIFSNSSSTGAVTYNSGAASENVAVQETATLVSGQMFTLQSLYVRVVY